MGFFKKLFGSSSSDEDMIDNIRRDVLRRMAEAEKSEGEDTAPDPSLTYDVLLLDARLEIYKASCIIQKYKGIRFTEARDMVKHAPCVVAEGVAYDVATDLCEKFRKGKMEALMRKSQGQAEVSECEETSADAPMPDAALPAVAAVNEEPNAHTEEHQEHAEVLTAQTATSAQADEECVHGEATRQTRESQTKEEDVEHAEALAMKRDILNEEESIRQTEGETASKAESSRVTQLALILAALREAASKAESSHAKPMKEWVFSRVYVERDSNEKIAVPVGVTSIGERCFSGKSITQIEIPATVRSIGDDAFYQCRFLEEISLPDSVTTIGKGVFSDCSSLETVNLSASLTTISESAFCRCSSLDEIILPDSVTTIGYGAFCQCKCLETLDMPAELNKLADEAFQFVALDQLDFSKCRKIQKLNLNAFGLQVRLGAVYMPPTLERLKGQSSAYFGTIFLPPTFRKTPSGAFLSRKIVCYSEEVESPAALLSCCKENLFLKPGYVETFVACLEAEGEDVESVGEGCYSVNGIWVGPIPPEDLYLYDD